MLSPHVAGDRAAARRRRGWFRPRGLAEGRRRVYGRDRGPVRNPRALATPPRDANADPILRPLAERAQPLPRCEHRTYLDILERRGELDAERRPPNMELLFERGERHEEAIVAALHRRGTRRRPTRRPGRHARGAAGAPSTRCATGARSSTRRAFSDDGWVGYPDFLIRVEEPSDLGDWSYEVHDAKLSGHAAAAPTSSSCSSTTRQLERIQGRRPARMHLILGDGERPAVPARGLRGLRRRVSRAQFVGAASRARRAGRRARYPYRSATCDFCHWWHVCDRPPPRRRSPLAGRDLQRTQGLKLEARRRPHASPSSRRCRPDALVPRLPPRTLDDLRAQAELQLRSRGLARPLYELLEPEHGRGLGRLPAPSAGDVHFDFEGDPYWGDEGLEYLFGTVYRRRRRAGATGRSGRRRAPRRSARFEDVDRLDHRAPRAHPGPPRLPLQLLRARRAQAAHAAPRDARARARRAAAPQGLRRPLRHHPPGDARRRRVATGSRRSSRSSGSSATRDCAARSARCAAGRPTWRTASRAQLDEIAAYNEDDCRQHACAVRLAAGPPRPRPRPSSASSSIARAEAADAAERRARCGTRTRRRAARPAPGRPARRRVARTTPSSARAAGLRPARLPPPRGQAGWWALFDRRERAREQLRDEDAEAIGGLEARRAERGQAVAGSWTLRFPEQEFKLEPGRGRRAATERAASTIVELDEAARHVVVRARQEARRGPAAALVPGGPVRRPSSRSALFRFADARRRRTASSLRRLDAAPTSCCAARRGSRRARRRWPTGQLDLERLAAQVARPRSAARSSSRARPAGQDLHRRAPRRRPDARRQARRRHGDLAQGDQQPARGDRRGRGRGPASPSAGGRRPTTTRSDYESDRVDLRRRRARRTTGRRRSCSIAGTAWLLGARGRWQGASTCCSSTRPGQMSLADAIAVAQGARSVVLLGDPQQLAHVSQGTHPVGSGASVLEHLLGERRHDPAGPRRLPRTTWRMHPDVCGFVSRDDVRRPAARRAGLRAPGIDSPGLCRQRACAVIGVEHDDNRGRVDEEAERDRRRGRPAARRRHVRRPTRRAPPI